MSGLVSVITPVHAPSPPHLPDAYESLRSQELPDGSAWEWLVQEDGQAGILHDVLPHDDQRIRPAMGRPSGPGVSRTQALARAGARSVVLNYWRTHGHRASVHPATLCIRRDLVLTLGGWMALPASEDTGLLIAASVVSDGYFNHEVGLLYRKWPGQVTGQAAPVDSVERDARMRLIDDRARALATLQFQ